MANQTPKYLLKRNNNTYSHRNLYMNVYSSLIHKCEKLETTQMSFNW